MHPLPSPTARLSFRLPTLDDADAYGAAFTDPEVMRYIGYGETDNPDATPERITRARETYERFGICLYALVRNDTGEVIGDCGLAPIIHSGRARTLEDRMDPDFWGPDIEVGYRLARAHWENGFATEGARACLEHGFRTLGLARIVGVTHPGNRASQRVLTKAGMIPRGLSTVYYDSTVELFEAEAETWR